MNATKIASLLLVCSIIATQPAINDVRPPSSMRPPVRLVQWVPAYGCCTPYMRCRLAAPQPVGTSCMCIGPAGPIPGYAC
jgi:hypothetical protein